MQLTDFEGSLKNTRPPSAYPPLLQALWWDAKGDWEMAHTFAQEVETADGAWVHAYLHRREGDQANARYWYRRAGQPPCLEALEAERTMLVTKLLSQA